MMSSWTFAVTSPRCYLQVPDVERSTHRVNQSSGQPVWYTPARFIQQQDGLSALVNKGHKQAPLFTGRNGNEGPPSALGCCQEDRFWRASRGLVYLWLGAC